MQHLKYFFESVSGLQKCPKCLEQFRLQKQTRDWGKYKPCDDHSWIKEYLKDFHWNHTTIYEDGSIDWKGNLGLSSTKWFGSYSSDYNVTNLSQKIPFKINTVSGLFKLNSCAYLTSLENMPDKILGEDNYTHHEILTIKNCPRLYEPYGLRNVVLGRQNSVEIGSGIYDYGEFSRREACPIAGLYNIFKIHFNDEAFEIFQESLDYPYVKGNLIDTKIFNEMCKFYKIKDPYARGLRGSDLDVFGDYRSDFQDYVKHYYTFV